MADMTVVDALKHAPASASKTAIDAAADDFVTALSDALAAEVLSGHQHAQIRSEFIDFLERVGSELSA
jgi:hypothetical protein